MSDAVKELLSLEVPSKKILIIEEQEPINLESQVLEMNDMGIQCENKKKIDLAIEDAIAEHTIEQEYLESDEINNLNDFGNIFDLSGPDIDVIDLINDELKEDIEYEEELEKELDKLLSEVKEDDPTLNKEDMCEIKKITGIDVSEQDDIIFDEDEIVDDIKYYQDLNDNDDNDDIIFDEDEIVDDIKYYQNECEI